jgi:hypothetical protein
LLFCGSNCRFIGLSPNMIKFPSEFHTLNLPLAIDMTILNVLDDFQARIFFFKFTGRDASIPRIQKNLI